MLLAHAVTLAAARSHLAALADHAATADASDEYDRVLLTLDLLHGDDIPAISVVLTDDRNELFDLAESTIEDLVDHGIDALQVELVLDGLWVARGLDSP